MLKTTRSAFAAILLLALAGLIAAPAMAQSKGGGKIVCWKDKAGKVVGCGDTVPPEYRAGASKELDSRGMTRKTTDSADVVAKRKQQDEAAAKQKAEDEKRAAEQKRQDATLLNIFSSEKEIDAKRDRDLGDIDVQITQLQGALNAATARYNDAKARNAKDDMARATAEKDRIGQSIAAKEKEKDEVRQRFAAQKKRFVELKGGSQAAPASAPAPAKK
jgi:hypothetical protein